MEALRMPISNQLSATSYGRAPYIDETASIEAQSELLPQLYAQRKQEEYFQEQTRLANEQRKQMNRDSNIALGIKGVELGYQAWKNPALQRYGRGVLDALKPKPAPIQGDFGTTPGLAPAQTQVATNSIQGTVSDTGTASWMPSRPTAKVTISSGTSTAPVMGSSGFQGVLPKFGGTGMGASAGNLAMGMIPGIAGSATGALVERSNFGEFVHKKGVMGEKEADIFGGALGGFLTGFALGGLPGGIAGGIGGLVKRLF